MHSNNKNTLPQYLKLPDTSKKRTGGVALTPPHTGKNRLSPLLILQDNGEMDDNTENNITRQPHFSPKIPPIYV